MGISDRLRNNSIIIMVVWESGIMHYESAVADTTTYINSLP